MSKQPQIMVIMDPAFQRSPAVMRGLSLARKSGAILQLRSFEHLRSVQQAIKRGLDLDAYLSGRRLALESFADGLRRDGVTVETGIIWGRPVAEKIIFDVLALRPELVIKDVPARSDWNRAFLSSLDWHLLAECPAPLMLVQPGSPSLPRHIMAAVDPLDEHGKPHELNDRILKAATALAMQCTAEIDVVNTFDYIPMAGEEEYAGWIPDLSLYGELRKIHAEGLYKLGKDHGVAPSQMHVLDGEAATRIASFAQKHHVDLVVMGSIYRTGLKRLFLGSTAEGVFDTLPCDVLLIKPEGFASELEQSLGTGKARAA